MYPAGRAHEPRERPTADPIGVISGGGHLGAEELPFANDHIGTGVGGGFQQPRRLVGQMLHVGIEEQHMREAASQRPRDAGPNRMPLAEVGGVRNDFSAGLARARFRRGNLGRPVVDDNHVRPRSRADAVDDVGNRWPLR